MHGGLINGNINDTNTHYGGAVCLFARVTGSAAPATTVFKMYGGTISQNKAYSGGGVNLNGPSVNTTDRNSRCLFYMYGGLINGNSARTQTPYGGAGGGVYVSKGSKFYMYDGVISNNNAYVGGGVATWDYISDDLFNHRPYPYEDWPLDFPADFIMYGGKITNNTSTGSGGGVYLASRNNEMHAGFIENNTSGNHGGGIYVAAIPYKVKLFNALITNNFAELLGGGFWFCPTGAAELSVNEGYGVFDNRAGTSWDPGSSGDDLVFIRSNSADITLEVSNRMMGGGLANWFRDGGAANDGYMGAPRSSVPRYVTDNPKIPIDSFEASANTCVAAKSVPSQETKYKSLGMAELFIRSNRARRGGGVGSNGDVETGYAERGLKDLTIRKEWGTIPVGVVKPSSVDVRVLIDGLYLGEFYTLSDANNWTAVAKGIPVACDIDIEEVTVDGFDPIYSWAVSEDGFSYTVVVKNEYIFDTDSKAVAIKKVWGDIPGWVAKPDSVSVRVLVDGEQWGDDIILNEYNNWNRTIIGLPLDADVDIEEIEVDGFTSTYTWSTSESGNIVSVEVKNEYNGPLTKNLSITKQWEGIPDGVTKPSSVLVQVLVNGNPWGSVITLDDTNEWSATVDGIPFDAIVEVEEAAVDNFAPSYFWDETGDATEIAIVVKNEYTGPRLKSIVIEKVWGDIPQWVDKPSSVQVIVTIDGEQFGSVITLNDLNDWSSVLYRIPFAALVEVQEVAIDGFTPSYTWDVSEDGNRITVTVKNEYSGSLTKSLTVTKQWGDIPTGVVLPSSVQVQVLVNGDEWGDVLTLNDSNSWTATVDDIPFDADVDIEEVVISTFTPSYDWDVSEDGTEIAVTVKNEYNPDSRTKSLTVKKEWEDIPSWVIKPSSVHVRILVGGSQWGDDITLNASNNWIYSVGGIPYEATVEVVEDVFYNFDTTYTQTVSEDGTIVTVTIKNKYNGPLTKSLIITKEFGDIPGGVAKPVSVQVKVMVDDVQWGDVVVLNASNNWTRTIEGIPYNAKVYVVEVAIDGFTPSYTWTVSKDGSVMSVVVKNTYNNDTVVTDKPVDEKKVPKTNDIYSATWLVLSGISSMGLGVLYTTTRRRRKSRQ